MSNEKSYLKRKPSRSRVSCCCRQAEKQPLHKFICRPPELELVLAFPSPSMASKKRSHDEDAQSVNKKRILSDVNGSPVVNGRDKDEVEDDNLEAS